MFNPQDGVLHLVFANPNDQYILPSLVRLSLRNYLCYQIRRNQCEFILFAREENGKVVLEPCDETSEQIIATKPKRFCQLFSPGVMIHDILKKNKRTALIMDLRVLNRLHKKDRSFVRGLIGQMDSYRSGQNLLVLTSTVSTEDSLPILADPEGPFQVQDVQGRSLCPELQNILRNGTQIPLYESMRNAMGERMRVLNCFDRTHLNRVVDRVLLHHPERIMTVQDQQNLIDVLYGWYQLPAFRDRFPNLMEENRWMKFSRLESALEKTEVWSRLCRMIRELCGGEKSVRPALEARFGPVDEKIMKLNIQVVDSLSNRFCQIMPPEEAGQETQAHFYELRQFYTTAWNRSRPEEVDDSVMEALDVLDTAVKQEHIGLVQCWVDSFYSYGRVYSCQENRSRDYFRLLHKLVKFLEEMDRIQRINQRNEDRIRILGEQIARARENMKYDILNPEERQCMQPYLRYQESREWMALSMERDAKRSNLKYGHEKESKLRDIIQYMKIELEKASMELSELPELDMAKIESHIEDCRTKFRALEEQVKEADCFRTEMEGDSQEEYA